MKKIVLAAALLLVAFTGNSSLKGSILVNTVSFADLPDKPVKQTQSAENARILKKNLKISDCPDQVKTSAKPSNYCLPVKWCTTPVTRP